MLVQQILKHSQRIATPSRRYLWAYVCQAFNRVDYHRLKEVGPDRMCTEWVLKNGGGVRFKENPNLLHTNYNSLPPENSKVTVTEVDGTKSTIMSIGFEHLKDCNYLTKIILDSCKYLDDEGVTKLHYVNKSLESLTIDKCRNISRPGLLELVQSVPNIKRLQLGRDMPLIKDMDGVVAELKQKLPQCEISIQ